MSRIDFTMAITAEARAAADLAEAKAEAGAQVIAMIEAATLAITGHVPLAEQLSWATKEVAARAFLAAPVDPPAILSGEASVTGEEVADLATRIIANADAYRAAVARLAGLRRLTMSAIEGAGAVLVVDAAVTGLASHLATMRGGQ